MTRELADKLIKHYEESVEMIVKEDEKHKIWGILRIRRINNGLCFCASEIFGEEIYGSAWLKKKIGRAGAYICNTPMPSFLKSQIIQSLQTRIDVLKQFPL